MKSPVRLTDMEMDTANFLTVAGGFVTLAGAGFGAIIRQAKANTRFDHRLQAVEDEKKEVRDSLKDISNSVHQIALATVEYKSDAKSTNEHLNSVSKSVVRIHERLDKISYTGG